MSARAPGHPEHKRRLLAQIDKRTFPYLVADVLALTYRHSEVRVVDGPGDGKRDIHSVVPGGAKCVTQCKYHEDVASSVSARDADELPVAAFKFGASCGFFVTNARLSPQACREYLESFPALDLTFLDGDTLLSNVLCDTTMSAHWLSGENFSRSGKLLFVPLILREVESDAVLDPFHAIADDVELGRCRALSSYFHPYRGPKYPNTGEDGGASVTMTSCIDIGPSVYLHELDHTRERMAARLASVLPPDRAITLRFGCPVQTAGSRFDDVGSTPLTAVAPRSFVLRRGKAHSEEDWLAPTSPRWRFPGVMPSEYSQWTSWVCDDLNIWLRVELPTPMADLPWSHGLRVFHNYARECRRVSLFATALTADCDEFLSKLPADLRPELECPNGPGGTLLGWLHPHLSDGAGFAITNDRLGVPVPGRDESFDQRVALAKELIQSDTSLRWVSPAAAEHIMAAQGINLGEECHVYDSSDILYFPGQIPSPILLNERTISLVSFWRPPNDKTSVRPILEALEIDRGAADHIYRGEVEGPSGGSLWGVVTYVFKGFPSHSTQDVLDEVERSVAEALGQLEETLLHSHGMVLASREFWDEELRIPLNGPHQDDIQVSPTSPSPGDK